MSDIEPRSNRLTTRQALALLAVTSLASFTVGAAAVGLDGLATALVATLVWAVFLSAVQLQRQLSALAAATERQARATSKVVSRELMELRSRVDEPAWADQLAAGQRRLLAVAEEERLAASDRQQTLLSTIDRSVREVLSFQTRDLEAMLQLYQGFRPRAPMPASGGWAMNASGLLRLLNLIEHEQPKIVLELGSGTSSVWIAYALERTGGRLITVDHAVNFAERTRSMLVMHSLQHLAEVRHAPLHPLRLDGRDFQWYAEEAFADLSDVSLLVVDGPPGGTCPAARYPALPRLEPKLSAQATIFVDDAHRPDERETLEQWTEAVSGLARDPHVTGHTALLRYSRY